MKDIDKTKEELFAEIAELSRRIEILGKGEADHRKTVEEALRESEAKFRQLFDITPAAIYEVDLTTGKIINVNDEMCEYLGYTKEEFLELGVLDFLKGESREKILERIDKMLKGEPVPHVDECEIITKDGHEICILFTARY